MAYREALSALADPTRREILERLSDAPMSVGQLADLVPVSRPAVSQHLRVLSDAGLVAGRTAGTRRIYRVDPSGIDALRTYLDGFWKRSLTAFAAAAERDPEEGT